MNLKTLLSGLLLIFISSGTSVAQTANIEHDIQSDQVKKWAAEVFQDCPEYLTEAYIEMYRKEVSKVSIKYHESLNEIYGVSDLSTVGIKDKCNPSLLHDDASTFDPKNFNPLKYFFNFYSDVDNFYHIEGTNYIITVSK